VNRNVSKEKTSLSLARTLAIVLLLLVLMLLLLVVVLDGHQLFRSHAGASFVVQGLCSRSRSLSLART